MEQAKRRGASIAGAVVAVIAALAMAFALVAQPVAAEAATITVNQSESGHNYSAYQILDATVTEDANHTNVRLSNVQWGSNVNESVFLSALKTSNISVYAATSNTGIKSNTTVGQVFANASNAADFAAVFDWASDNSALLDAVAGIINNSMADSDSTNDILKGSPITSKGSAPNYNLTVNDPGYYYIQDGQASTTNGRYFVQVFNDDKEVAAKNATPSLEKKVLENTKATDQTQYGSQYNDTADYEIGDYVTFKLIGTIPDMSAYNNGYRYTITDVLSTSLDRPANNDVKVFLTNSKDVAVGLTGGTLEETSDVTSEFKVTASDSPANSMTIEPNVSASSSKRSGANDLSAVTGISGYKYVVVVYKAKLNDKAALGQQTIDGNTLGEVGTHHGNVNKAHLSYSNNPSFPDGTDEHTGTTPDDYVIVFTYSVDLTKVSAADTGTAIQNASFVLSKGTGDNAQYATLSGNATNGWKLTGWGDRNSATTMTTEANGKVQISGLDHGTYYLTETVTPGPYNKPSQPWTITITADTSNGQSGAGAVTELRNLSGTVSNDSFTNNVVLRGQDKGLVSGEVTGAVTTGLVTATITNTQGFELPQTGGAATLALMIAGLALVAAAIVIAVIRRRAHDEA